MGKITTPTYCFDEKNGVVQLLDFSPRNSLILDNFLDIHRGKKIYYYQKHMEGFSNGRLFSYVFYTPSIKFNLRSTSTTSIFRIEEGKAVETMTAVQNLAIQNNENEIIFDSSMLSQFNANTPLIEKSGFCYQLYDGDKIVAHASVVKTADKIFGNGEIYVLMRFIVDKSYRKTEIKEILMSKLAEKIPPNAPLYLQIFPKNSIAISFFLRRMNINCFYEKWVNEKI